MGIRVRDFLVCCRERQRTTCSSPSAGSDPAWCDRLFQPIPAQLALEGVYRRRPAGIDRFVDRGRCMGLGTDSAAQIIFRRSHANPADLGCFRRAGRGCRATVKRPEGAFPRLAGGRVGCGKVVAADQGGLAGAKEGPTSGGNLHGLLGDRLGGRPPGEADARARPGSRRPDASGTRRPQAAAIGAIASQPAEPP